jgi:hypothetical protein
MRSPGRKAAKAAREAKLKAAALGDAADGVRRLPPLCSCALLVSASARPHKPLASVSGDLPQARVLNSRLSRLQVEWEPRGSAAGKVRRAVPTLLQLTVGMLCDNIQGLPDGGLVGMPDDPRSAITHMLCERRLLSAVRVGCTPYGAFVRGISNRARTWQWE